MKKIELIVVVVALFVVSGAFAQEILGFDHNVGGNVTYTYLNLNDNVDKYNFDIGQSQYDLNIFYKVYMCITNWGGMGLKLDVSFNGGVADYSYADSENEYWKLFAFAIFCKFGSSENFRVKYGEIYIDWAMPIRDSIANFWGINARYNYLGVDFRGALGNDFVMDYKFTINGYLDGLNGMVEFVPKIGYKTTKYGGGFVLGAGINYLFKKIAEKG